jgi:hypothetical protein
LVSFLIPVVAGVFVAFGHAGVEAHDDYSPTFAASGDHHSFTHNESKSRDAGREEDKVEDVHYELRTNVAIEFFEMRMWREWFDFLRTPRFMSLCTLAGERLRSAPASLRV